MSEDVTWDSGRGRQSGDHLGRLSQGCPAEGPARAGLDNVHAGQMRSGQLLVVQSLRRV